MRATPWASVHLRIAKPSEGLSRDRDVECVVDDDTSDVGRIHLRISAGTAEVELSAHDRAQWQAIRDAVDEAMARCTIEVPQCACGHAAGKHDTVGCTSCGCARTLDGLVPRRSVA